MKFTQPPFFVRFSKTPSPLLMRTSYLEPPSISVLGHAVVEFEEEIAGTSDKSWRSRWSVTLYRGSDIAAMPAIPTATPAPEEPTDSAVSA